jgi:hypothetical protein
MLFDFSANISNYYLVTAFRPPPQHRIYLFRSGQSSQRTLVYARSGMDNPQYSYWIRRPLLHYDWPLLTREELEGCIVEDFSGNLPESGCHVWMRANNLQFFRHMDHRYYQEDIDLSGEMVNSFRTLFRNIPELDCVPLWAGRVVYFLPVWYVLVMNEM